MKRRSWLSWPAFPGPVFRRELGSTARGRWFYLVRALGAGALTYYVGASTPFREVLSPGNWSPGVAADVGFRTLREFEADQFFLVLALVPLLVAGSVAEEKARGTLGLLLAGRLSSFEIIADKLAARLLTVLVLVAVGLPVLALIGLLGGVDPGELAMVYGVTLSSAWFSASLSILVSVHARSATGAVVGAYAACLAWVFLPVWLATTLDTNSPPWPVDWLRLVVREVARVSPLSVAWSRDIWGLWAMTRGGYAAMIREMVGLQVLGGLVLFALAAWRLRPVYRAQVGGSKGNRLGRLTRVLGLNRRSKPDCGDDPMAWKERYAPESAWMARLSVLAGVALVMYSIRHHFFVFPGHLNLAFDEMFTHGLDIGTWGVDGGRRAVLNYVLCEQAAILFGSALVASTILAASSIAGERGRGTWSGLLGTPLERRGILRAKMWGAVRSIRALLGLMLVLYLASMAATALHPAGFVLVVLAVPAFLGFALALGTYVSVRSKNAGRAIVRSVILLAAVNLVPVVALYPLAGPASTAVVTPILLMFLAMSRAHFSRLSHEIAIESSEVRFILLPLGIIAAHAVGAWLLTRAAARRIERDEG